MRTLQTLRSSCIDGQTSYIITAPSSSAITPTTATARKTIFEIKKQTTYGFYSAHYSMVIEYSSTAVVEPHEIHTRMYFTYMIMNEYDLPATKEYDIATTNSYESLRANKLRLSGCVTFYLPDTNSDFSIGIQNVGYTGSNTLPTLFVTTGDFELHKVF